MNKAYNPGFHFTLKNVAVFLTLVMVFSLMFSQPSAISKPLDEAVDHLSEASSQDQLAEATNEVVKTAINPLLVMFVKLATHQIKLESADNMDESLRSEINLRRFFLVVLGSFLLSIFLKEGLSVTPLSLIKKAGDAAEAQSSPLLALLGLASLLPGVIEHLTPGTTAIIQSMFNSFNPAQAYASAEPELAISGFSTLSTWLGGAVVTVVSTIVYSAVWLISNAFIVLCLILPAPLGPVVKSCRLALIGALHTLSLYHPWLALVLSLAIIIFAFMLCRWSFKLTVWSLLYSFDFLTRRWRKHAPGLEPVAFISAGGRKKLKIGKRTYGRLIMENGRLFFRYRIFLLFPKKVELPSSDRLVLGRRLLGPVLLMRVEKRLVSLLTFRLSCRTHEELLARQLGGLEILEVGLSKWLKGAWSGMNKDVSPLKAENATVLVST